MKINNLAKFLAYLTLFKMADSMATFFDSFIVYLYVYLVLIHSTIEFHRCCSCYNIFHLTTKSKIWKGRDVRGEIFQVCRELVTSVL